MPLNKHLYFPARACVECLHGMTCLVGNINIGIVRMQSSELQYAWHQVSIPLGFRNRPCTMRCPCSFNCSSAASALVHHGCQGAIMPSSSPCAAAAPSASISQSSRCKADTSMVPVCSSCRHHSYISKSLRSAVRQSHDPSSASRAYGAVDTAVACRVVDGGVQRIRKTPRLAQTCCCNLASVAFERIGCPEVPGSVSSSLSDSLEVVPDSSCKRASTSTMRWRSEGVALVSRNSWIACVLRTSWQFSIYQKRNTVAHTLITACSACSFCIITTVFEQCN